MPGRSQAPICHSFNDFDHVVHVALGVGPTGMVRRKQIHRGRVGVQAEHHRADLAATDSALKVQGAGERLARVGRLARELAARARKHETPVPPR